MKDIFSSIDLEAYFPVFIVILAVFTGIMIYSFAVFIKTMHNIFEYSDYSIMDSAREYSIMCLLSLSVLLSTLNMMFLIVHWKLTYLVVFIIASTIILLASLFINIMAKRHLPKNYNVHNE